MHMPVSAVHQSALAVNSRQPMQFSFHVQQKLTKYHTQLVHETLEGHVTSLVPDKQLFGGLPSIRNSFQFQTLAKLHLQLVVSVLPSQPTPQHQYQQYIQVSGYGHVVQHVLHAAAYECLPLHGCMGQVSVCPVVVVHKEPRYSGEVSLHQRVMEDTLDSHVERIPLDPITCLTADIQL